MLRSSEVFFVIIAFVLCCHSYHLFGLYNPLITSEIL